ncbi:PE-PGRS family protein [Streptomyces noursei]|uniref:PE-PGRS family protein n=1 Tax=Streptomyces noursei TaxID=1971 RepID=UPI0030EFF70F
MTAGSVSRAVRAAIFAAVCVTTTALGHGLMSVQPLPWWALVAAFGATGSAAWWLAGRERGAFVITGSTVVAQLGLHSLFGLAQASPGGTVTTVAPERQWAARLLCGAYEAGPAPESQALAIRLLRQAGLDPAITHATPAMSMGGMQGMSGMADMPAMHAMGMGHMGSMSGDVSQMQLMHSGGSAIGMFLAHVLAALVCGVWLWRGEAAAFQLARSVAAVLFAPLLLVLTVSGWTGLKRPVRRPVGAGHVVRLHGVLLQHTVSRRGPPRLSFCC